MNFKILLFMLVFVFLQKNSLADLFGADLPFLAKISIDQVQLLLVAKETLLTAKKQLTNAIQTYDTIRRSYEISKSYYDAAKDGVQLRDIDLVLGSGTALSIKGVYDGIKKGRGIARKNLVALRNSVENSIDVTDRLASRLNSFAALTKEVHLSAKQHGSSAKGVMEIGNHLTKALIDLNALEIMHSFKNTQMENELRMARLERQRLMEEELYGINSEIEGEIEKPPFSYRDPMREE